MTIWSSRKAFTRFWSWLLALAAIASLGIATCFGEANCWIRPIIVAWVLLPPVFLWAEWVFFVPAGEVEPAKHTHDLARNISLAPVTALLTLSGVKPFGA